MEKSDKPKDTIKMISRFNEERVMHRTSENSYLYNPDTTYMRSGFLGNGKRFIDPRKFGGYYSWEKLCVSGGVVVVSAKVVVADRHAVASRDKR